MSKRFTAVKPLEYEDEYRALEQNLNLTVYISIGHESGLAPLFHTLSASFSQRNHFFRVFQVCPGERRTAKFVSPFLCALSLKIT